MMSSAVKKKCSRTRSESPNLKKEKQEMSIRFQRFHALSLTLSETKPELGPRIPAFMPKGLTCARTSCHLRHWITTAWFVCVLRQCAGSRSTHAARLARPDLPIDIHEDGNQHVQKQQNRGHHVGAEEEECNLPTRGLFEHHLLSATQKWRWKICCQWRFRFENHLFLPLFLGIYVCNVV